MTRAYVDKVRHLVLVLGDQLDRNASALDGFDPDHDAVLMMEVAEEATYIPQHKIRLVLFFSAMRHHRDWLRERGATVHYVELDDPNNRGGFADEVQRWVNKARPEKLIVTQPGDYRVLAQLREASAAADCELEVREDRHFLCTLEDFRSFADGRKRLLLETFYRHMRRQHDILMEEGEPAGERWNFDQENRESFGKSGPPDIKTPRSFRPDAITTSVMAMVERRFGDSPGSLDDFDYPVTYEQAREALRDFVQHRLVCFGTYQDAMVTGRPYLYHSRLSCMLNLHLLDPRDAIAAAEDAYREGRAPLNSVEGFVRQILGWREYIRGIYWLRMPEYAESNALDADRPMPAFMWTGDTDMNCIAQSVAQLRAHAYAHHIQRLMVLGLFSLLLGVRPGEVHKWHMSMYADAIDWVSLPNVIGMSQYADGGVVGTKPYAASGNYVNRMSDYCADCRFDPGTFEGEDACPFTVLYWDFLSRNRRKLGNNRRMALQYKNLDRKNDGERRTIRDSAGRLRDELTRDAYFDD